MFEIVKKAIDDFNLYGLLPEAPNDEFDIESKKIARQINAKSTVNEIAEIIANVFSKAFNKSFDTKKFLVPAEKIYNAIKNNGN